MKKSFAALLLILTFSSAAFSQVNGQQSLIKIESLPVLDSLPKTSLMPVKVKPIPLTEMLSEKSQGVSGKEDELSERAWVSGEFLLWTVRGSNLPPLITVGPPDQNDITVGRAVIGAPGTVIAFGGDRLDQGTFTGGRLTAGLWLNKGKTLGAEVSYFSLEKKTYRFQVSSSGLPGSQTISRPYLFAAVGANTITLSESALPIADPSFFRETNPPRFFRGTGTGTFSGRLQGAEASLLYRLGILRCCHLTLLTGFRYLDLNQALTVGEIRDVSNGSFGRFYETLADQFNTRNQFYGGQAGLRSTSNKGRFSLELSGTVALGSNHETVIIQGVRTNSAIAEGNVESGLLAFSTNIGSYSRNQFTVIPELKANVGFDLVRWLRPFISYQFLYWNKVVMPGEQIDRAVSFASVGTPSFGPRRPAFSFNDTGFWAQGLTTGVRLRF